MIIGKLIKPCKIIIYDQKEDGGEIESFTLLKLSLLEVYDLLKLSKDNERLLDDSICIKYSGNDEVHKKWKDLCMDHLKASPSNFTDVSKSYITTLPGTSCLVREPDNHVIKIAYRKGNDKCTINRICIDNVMREKFFLDCKLSKMFKEDHRYAIDTRDLEMYTYWSKYMNSLYLQSIRK